MSQLESTNDAISTRSPKKLMLSFILLFVLYLLLEATYLLAPLGASFQGAGSYARHGNVEPWYAFPLFVVSIVISGPALLITPIIAFFQGLWYAAKKQLCTIDFFVRFIAITSACKLVAILSTNIQHVESISLCSAITVFAGMPAIAFLLGGLLMQAGKWIYAHVKQ